MPHWLKKRRELSPERVALVAEHTVWTFAELDERAGNLARRLAGLGLAAGEPVAALLRNNPQAVALIHALGYTGAAQVLLNTRLTATELAWQIRDAGVRLLVYDWSEQDKAEQVGKLCPGLRLLVHEEAAALPPAGAILPAEISLDALHTIIYTSGTTGHPKGVMLSWSNHWWSAVGSCLNLGLTPEDRWLMCLPLFHVSGLSVLMKSVIYGMTVVLRQAFDPVAANRMIRENGITHMSVVSAMLTRMLAELQDQAYPPAFRCMLLGGGPAPLPLLEACTAKGIPVFQTYGLTESASQIVTLAPEYMLRKLGSAGKPLFPAELKIVHDGSGAVPPHEIGEIAVKGPNVTAGYYRREEATDAALRDGWLCTGDLGYLDEDGFLYVVDRRSDLIISGGENVYPAEIEAVLLAHPAVAEAGVTGQADERWGQVPVAFVRLHPGAEAAEQDIRDFCQARLARYKVPIAVHVVRELPRNAAGKLVRRKLPDMLDGTKH